jgi:signal transduction histidine kinase
MIAVMAPGGAGTGRPRTLPFRLWLLPALVAIAVVPAVIQAALAAHWQRPLVPPAAAATAAELRRDAARWDDPPWRAALAARLAPQGMRVVLVDAAGRERWRSADGQPDAPILPTGEPVTAPLGTAGPAGGADRFVGMQEIVARDPSAAADGRQLRRAQLFFPVTPPDPRLAWLPAFVGLAALLLILAGIAWLVGRAVLSPLAAIAAGARAIAAGDPAPRLPGSPVREVAEAAAAFTAMGAALRRAAEREAALDGERRLFVGAVAHDLRTPLFALRGYLELLERGAAEPPARLARYLANSRELAATLERLIADLFAYARVELLEEAPRREPLDLATALRDIVDGHRPRAETRGVALVLEGAATPCPVAADRHLLARAVGNLLDNALRHTPPGGAVTVRWECSGGGAAFEVADTGPGIAAADLPHLFTPLYRGEASRNRRTGGIGLGLTIARRILLAHGGDLAATNGPRGGAILRGSIGSAESKSG